MSQPNDIREIIELCDRVQKVLDGKRLTLQLDVLSNMVANLALAQVATNGATPEHVVHAVKKNALHFIRQEQKDQGIKTTRN